MILLSYCLFTVCLELVKQLWEFAALFYKHLISVSGVRVVEDGVPQLSQT